MFQWPLCHFRPVYPPCQVFSAVIYIYIHYILGNVIMYQLFLLKALVLCFMELVNLHVFFRSQKFTAFIVSQKIIFHSLKKTLLSVHITFTFHLFSGLFLAPHDSRTKTCTRGPALYWPDCVTQQAAKTKDIIANPERGYLNSLIPTTKPHYITAKSFCRLAAHADMATVTRPFVISCVQTILVDVAVL